ncbi:dihydroorotase [Agitococcus lubricus]|uniref:Dihydroorotase n=1 Tax=Agitococcus lubricus TaxID=1077255 RepID=A0A2T5J3C6_9GAMM|nr:dihydroorotase [Agitococcus lubricus]PTQ91092.1 dihydroorotase [Agitococcus lubricus]
MQVQQQRTLLVGGRVIDIAANIDRVADVLVDNGRMVAMGAEARAAQVTHVQEIHGHYVLPAFIDLCASLREGEKQHGSMLSENKAALHGGFAHVVLPPNPKLMIDNAAIVAQLHEKTAQAGLVKVYPIGALTKGLEGKQPANMHALMQAGCIAVTNARQGMANDETLLRCLEYAASLNITVFFYPEEPSLATGCVHDGFTASRLGLPAIPSIAETIALAKQLLLVEETGVKAHFSQLSCKGSVELIRIAKAKGLSITADVAMHQLHLTDAAIDGFNSLAHVRPPLRSEEDRLALCAALQSGVIDAICSHHQPLNAAAKLAPFPATEAGISALETVLPLGLKLVRDGLLTEDKLWRALTVNPARILGLEAGALTTGAGVIVVDPAATWHVAPETLVSLGQNTPFLGMTVQGRVQSVFL